MQLSTPSQRLHLITKYPYIESPLMNRKFMALLAMPLLLAACSTEPETVTITETITTTITETTESAPETITITAAPEEPTESPTADPSARQQRVTSVDKIGGQVVRDYGVEITDQEFANVSAPICDLFEAGGTLADAKQLVINEVGTNDWQATKVVQGSVVQKCVQYVDQTY